MQEGAQSESQILESAVTQPPSALKLAEGVLGSSDVIGVSDQLDVASIFYTAVATVVGSLCGASLFLLLYSLDPDKFALWLALLLGAVTLGGMLGFAVVAAIFNARGYMRWERKYRPNVRP